VNRFKARYEFRGLRVNGERAPVTDTEVQAFALEDESSWVNNGEGDELPEEDDESDEDVVVEDPTVLIDEVERLKTYFRNTACP
jgi:hypothetical protein